jgi:hypothetical protein
MEVSEWCVKTGDRRQETGFRRERQPNGDRSYLISSAPEAPEAPLLTLLPCSVNYELRITNYELHLSPSADSAPEAHLLSFPDSRLP